MVEGIFGVEERARFKRLVKPLDMTFVSKVREKRAKELEKLKNDRGGKTSIQRPPR